MPTDPRITATCVPFAFGAIVAALAERPAILRIESVAGIDGCPDSRFRAVQVGKLRLNHKTHRFLACPIRGQIQNSGNQEPSNNIADN
jgi:hypothetical protein